jgi:hypothetical protein
VVESTILTETAQFVFVSQNKHDAWHEIWRFLITERVRENRAENGCGKIADCFL